MSPNASRERQKANARGVNDPAAHIRNAMNLTVDVALVRRRYHPSNVGKPVAAWVGTESGRYSPHDVVGPILDSMKLYALSQGSHACTLEEQTLKKRKREQEAKAKKPMTFLAVLQGEKEPPLKPKANCPCVEKNPKLLVESNDGDCMVCSSCGIVGPAIAISQTREKACAAEDDKTKHADAPKPVNDRFSEPALNLQMARRAKEGPKPGAILGTDRTVFGFAAENVARMVARADRARETLSAKDQTRELQLLVRLEKLFQHLEPAPDALKRYMRVESYSFFHAYIDHCGKCESTHCRFSGLRGKSLQYLATTCMAATIEQLSDGSCTVEVQPEQLEAIIERHGENVPAGTRTAVRELRLFLNAAHKESDMPVCAAGSQTVAVELAAEDEKKRVAEEESEKEGGAFGRQLRVFVRKLHFVEGHDLVEHTMQFYIGKYETIQASVEASDLSWPARAFAAMEIAARAKEGLGLREHSSRMRPALLASLGATSVAVMELVQELYDRLNTGSSVDHTCA